jgi:SAM-dependent methyltransferase
MNEPEQVRRSVSQVYADALNSPKPCCTGGSNQKGTLVKLAGYAQSELQKLPDGAVVNSFGCGNPLAFTEVKPGDVVLDLGCGAGIDLLLAARKVGPSGCAIGVDMTAEMIARAREAIEASGLPNVEVRQGLIENLPVEPDSVDWVISNCVINLSPEKDRVFAEIARALKRGGQMLVSDVVAEDLPREVRENPTLYCSCVAGATSEKDYCDGLRHAGLVDIEVRERIEYDLAQLEGLMESDLVAPVDSGCCCSGGPGDAGSKRQLARMCRGKVWSVQVYARKPR